MYNLAREVREYEELFYNKYVRVIIKIYDDAKIWDADNRNYRKMKQQNLYRVEVTYTICCLYKGTLIK